MLLFDLMATRFISEEYAFLLLWSHLLTDMLIFWVCWFYMSCCFVHAGHAGRPFNVLRGWWRKWAYRVALHIESHDIGGWEGQSGSFQSHSHWTAAVWQGTDSHTHTLHTRWVLGYWEGVCACVFDKKQLEVEEVSVFALYFSVYVSLLPWKHLSVRFNVHAGCLWTLLWLKYILEGCQMLYWGFFCVLWA